MFRNLSPAALGISGHQCEIIELALTFGFSAMDLDLPDFAVRAKLRGMPYARRLIDSGKIGLGFFQLPLNWESDDEVFKKDLEKLAEYVPAASELGCDRCLATLAPAGDVRPYHENFEFHRYRFTEICKTLEPAGIRLGLGFQAAEYLRKDKAFQFIHDFESLTLLTNMVEADNIGILLDTWDLVAGGGSIDAIANLSADQIVAVQVAEMPADVPLVDLDENSRLLPCSEDSQIDTIAALKSLSEIGYDGPVSVKPSRSQLKGKRRDLTVRLVGNALKQAWQGAGLVPGVAPVETPAEVETPAPAES